MQQMQLSHGVTLYQGDALQVLASLPTPSQRASPSGSPGACVDTWADAVLTDPPYCSGGTSMTARQADPASKYQQSGTKRAYPPMLGDAKDQRSWTRWCTLWLAECWRLAKDGAPLMVFTDWRQLPALTDAVQAAGWKWLGIVPWDKGNARPQVGKFRQQCEYVVFACKGTFKPGSTQCLPGLFKYPVIAGQKVHITSKPVALIRACWRLQRLMRLCLIPSWAAAPPEWLVWNLDGRLWAWNCRRRISMYARGEWRKPWHTEIKAHIEPKSCDNLTLRLSAKYTKNEGPCNYVAKGLFWGARSQFA